ncbi:MAG: sulfurtransferase complex subunit TusB [Candidatus Oxydemutatoraceae bacterium WSBS_2016_MAG_OTU14]
MATLHTINKSPFERDSAKTCLRLSQKDSGVLFIEDGVLAAIAGSEFEKELETKKDNLRFYVLVPDLKARGFSIDNLKPGIEAVDYDGFVDLTIEYDHVHAWL